MGCHIQVTNLDLSYQWQDFDKPIFQNLNLCIETGSFVSIIGRNGCGKSSLIKLVLGLLAPDRGQIFLEGEPVQAGYPDSIQKQRVAYLAQQIEELFYAETVSQELSYQRAGSAAKQAELLAKLGLNNCLHRSVETLSGGERQGVALAQFMMQKAPLLILDEPSSYLDQSRAAILREYLTQVHKQNGTILHVTQYPAELAWGTHVIDLDQPVIDVVKL